MTKEKFKNLTSPYILILCGLPMSGKSFFCKKYFPDTLTISRDELVMEVYGSKDYNMAFKNVDQKAVDKLLRERITSASSAGVDVIIDMTNLSRKVRIKNLSYFSNDYIKKVVVFPVLEMDEYSRRNTLRNINENKYIPLGVINSMMSSFTLPTLDEGFDEIIKL